MSASSTITNLGTWSAYSNQIPAEEEAIFDEAFKEMVGVSYTPLAYSKKITTGTNYKFFCNARAMHPDSPYHSAIVIVTVPLHGAPHISDIKILD